jgi:hypothetical protein
MGDLGMSGVERSGFTIGVTWFGHVVRFAITLAAALNVQILLSGLG